MLTLQFVPYNEIENLDSESRISKLLRIVRSNEIVLMEGRLKSDEEARLIEETMKLISLNFKGIEICTIYPNTKNLDFMRKVKRVIGQILLGDREGLTVIGPATVVKEIRRDPNKVRLFTYSGKGRR